MKRLVSISDQMLKFVDTTVADICVTRDLTRGTKVTVTWNTRNGCTANVEGSTVKKALALAIKVDSIPRGKL